MSTYIEKLKHPKWQKKRLEILGRDSFKCRSCHAEENTLHVHHLYYRKGNDPWDYPNACLITLCDQCHDIEHDERNDAIFSLINSFSRRGATIGDLYGFCAALDFSGMLDSEQVTQKEWDFMSGVLKKMLEYKYSGGELLGLESQINEIFEYGEG